MVVAVEGGEGVGVIVDHPQHVSAGIVHQFLRSQGARQQIHGLAQLQEFGALLAQTLFVDGVALDQMIAEHLGGPLAKLGAALRFHSVADRNDDVEIVMGNRLVGKSNVHNLHIAFFVQLSLAKYIAEVLGDNRPLPLEQLRQLILSQPDRFVVKLDFQTGFAVLRLKKNNFPAAKLIIRHLPSPPCRTPDPPSTYRAPRFSPFWTTLPCSFNCRTAQVQSVSLMPVAAVISARV